MSHFKCCMSTSKTLNSALCKCSYMWHKYTFCCQWNYFEISLKMLFYSKSAWTNNLERKNSLCLTFFVASQELLTKFRTILTEVIKPWKQPALLQLKVSRVASEGPGDGRSVLLWDSPVVTAFPTGTLLKAFQASHAHWGRFLQRPTSQLAKLCCFLDCPCLQGKLRGPVSPSALPGALAVQVEPVDTFFLLNHECPKAGTVLSSKVSWSANAVLPPCFVETDNVCKHK